MTKKLQIKTLVRLVTVLAVGAVATTFLAGPSADAAVDGYGISTFTASADAIDVWHDPSLIEGRSAIFPSSSH